MKDVLKLVEITSPMIPADSSVKPRRKGDPLAAIFGGGGKKPSKEPSAPYGDDLAI